MSWTKGAARLSLQVLCIVLLLLPSFLFSSTPPPLPCRDFDGTKVRLKAELFNSCLRATPVGRKMHSPGWGSKVNTHLHVHLLCVYLHWISPEYASVTQVWWWSNDASIVLSAQCPQIGVPAVKPSQKCWLRNLWCYKVKLKLNMMSGWYIFKIVYIHACFVFWNITPANIRNNQIKKNAARQNNT